jgi:Holliday junction resolvasome RuvABC ATP-dependent DNA helicase subunit/ribosomal protein L12E/L44/L45/RPP1/RPP2
MRAERHHIQVVANQRRARRIDVRQGGNLMARKKAERKSRPEDTLELDKHKLGFAIAQAAAAKAARAAGQEPTEKDTKNARKMWRKAAQHLAQNDTSRFTQEEWARVAVHFEIAVDLDPHMADAWLGLHLCQPNRRFDAVDAMARSFHRFGEERRLANIGLDSSFQTAVSNGWDQPLSDSDDLRLAVAVRELDRMKAIGGEVYDLRADIMARRIEGQDIDQDTTRALRSRFDAYLKASQPPLQWAQNLQDHWYLADMIQIEVYSDLFYGYKLIGEQLPPEVCDALQDRSSACLNNPDFTSNQLNVDWARTGLILAFIGQDMFDATETLIPRLKFEVQQHYHRGLVEYAKATDVAGLEAALACFQRAIALNPNDSLSQGQYNFTKQELELRRHNMQKPQSAPNILPGAADADSGENDADRAQVYAETLTQLQNLTGMESVVEQIEDYAALIEFARERAAEGLPDVKVPSLHTVFTGPPGTGKTTVARLFARLLYGLGLLPTDTFKEASRQDLVGRFVGHTADKTREVLEAAHGGVLFIDEAYSLVQEGLHGGDAFGSEAILELLAYMENNRGHIAVIVAGYDDDMERFLSSNPGLESRFSKKIHFKSYSPAALEKILLKQFAGHQDQLTADAQTRVAEFFQQMEREKRLDQLGNARLCRNLEEYATQHRARRRLRSKSEGRTLEDLTTITVEDIDYAIQQKLQ